MFFRARTLLLLLVSIGTASSAACSSSDEPSTASPTADASADALVAATDPDTFAFEKGAKITEAKQGEWTWVPFADSSCANGTSTGIGVNLGTTKHLVIFLEGGGACWDPVTCYTLNTAAYISKPFDQAAFEERVAKTDGSLFDRGMDANTFKDASFVYVPYCTGDVHGGDVEADYDGKKTRHFGRKNFEAFLKRIVPTFEDADRVILSGSSAGGFGAALHFWRTQYAFGSNVRVDLVDDSGPPFPNDKMTYIDTWRTAWNFDAALPPGCAECKTDLSQVFPYYIKKYTKSRFALLSYTQDGTISKFYSLAPADFETDLIEVVTGPFASSKSAAFIVSGSKHTMLGDLSTASGAAESPDGGSDAGPINETGTKLSTWLTHMTSDDPTWQTVGLPAK